MALEWNLEVSHEIWYRKFTIELVCGKDKGEFSIYEFSSNKSYE